MAKMRTVVMTVEVQTTMNLNDLRWHVGAALAEHFVADELEVQQVGRPQVTQPPAPPAAKSKTRRPTEVELT